MEKQYFVDVPVQINIWIREECQKKQFDVLRRVRPSVLFIQSDGGRNEREKTVIEKNRRMIEEKLDWDCKVHKIYSDTNLGMYAMGRKTLDYVFSKVDRCIIMEDDNIPAESFFRFCAELLEKYKDDERVALIMGANPIGINERCSADYFFSNEGKLSTIATWRRTYEKFYNYNYANDEYILKLLKNNLNYKKKISDKIYKTYHEFANGHLVDNHPAGGEFFFDVCYRLHGQVAIIPKYNQVSNIGATSEATHSTDIKNIDRYTRRHFNQPIYELRFPLKHPEYFVYDSLYNESMISYFGLNRGFFRKIEHYYLTLKNEGFLYFVRKILRKREKET